ncbi:S8 family peptidase [Bacillus cereus]|uniref:S8 family peptidase n=1 Tax=Bacillus cereus TaxID=1396 RepID=UPI001594EF14|nr:S8 family peptidase [Bacillus cereus]
METSIKFLQASFGEMEFKPLFISNLIHEELETKMTLKSKDTPEIDLDSYYSVNVPKSLDSKELVKEFSKLDIVDSAYIAGPPCPPPSVNPSDDPYSSYQGYLNSAPDGIDAKYIWQFEGGDGLGITFVDLEQGWNFQHEDLQHKSIQLISGLNFSYHTHGTSVLGELVSEDNMIGTIGIVPNATAKAVSQWQSSDEYDTARAIYDAVNTLQYGDVLLLEAQTIKSHHSGYLPVEVEEGVFVAIQAATSKGIVVIEAAGNGSNDLDHYRDENGKYTLNRNSPDFKDSGAIMVAAATATSPHRRILNSQWGSNCGTRIDCYGWGERVTTTSGNIGENRYTYEFGGTSSASPIIAGAAIAVQGLRKAKYGQAYNPYILRDILKAANLNTPSVPGDKIGYMPNLKAIADFVL